MELKKSPSIEGGKASNALNDIRVPLERFGRLLSTAAILFIVAYAVGVSVVLTSGYVEGESRQVDFVALWAAAKLAVAGDPILAFDQEALRSVQLLPPDSDVKELYWLYPPGLQLLLTPLGLLPYWAAACLHRVVASRVHGRSVAFCGRGPNGAQFAPRRTSRPDHDAARAAHLVVVGGAGCGVARDGAGPAGCRGASDRHA